MAAFEIGDVVQLKSGGPNMTVSNAATSGIACVYYNQIKGEMVRETFYPAQLRQVSGAPQPVHVPQPTRG